MPYNLPLEMIYAARERIAPYIRHTPLAPLPNIGAGVPAHVRLKLENLQVAGSFKSRGVFNTLLQLNSQQRSRGVITASGGNHGVALAMAAHRLGIPATVYLAETATPDRVARVARWNAQLIQHGRVWDEAHARAVAHAAESDLYYVHPFDAEATIAGQSTLGLELLEDLPEVDCVLIAIGGGGLIGGMAAAIKQLKPSVRIIGVEPVGAASMTASVVAGHVEPLADVQTIADTLALRAVCDRTLDLVEQYADDLVLVDDRAMLDAMRWLWMSHNQIVEPSGAAVLAAIMTGAADVSGYQCPVALICGGNAAAEPIWENYRSAAIAKGSWKAG